MNIYLNNLFRLIYPHYYSYRVSH